MSPKHALYTTSLTARPNAGEPQQITQASHKAFPLSFPGAGWPKSRALPPRLSDRPYRARLPELPSPISRRLAPASLSVWRALPVPQPRDQLSTQHTLQSAAVSCHQKHSQDAGDPAVGL